MTSPSELRTSDELATPKTDAAAYYVSAVNIDAEVISADFSRAQERRISELEQAMTKVRETLRCTKTAPHAYDADHHCDTCGSSSAYAKDLIDEVIRP